MSVWNSAEFDNHEQVCFFSDEATGLKAVVAIHSTTLGPAAGGTRFKDYATEDLAVDDALRLSRAMSYKSALAGMPVGGGKSVIIGDPEILKSTGLLHAYGRFIDRLGAYYATGEDVGISVADIEIVNEVTPYVGGTSAGSGDPSVPTAAGVVQGLRAVVERQFNRSSFAGLRVAVQGLGAVGWGVAERLHAAGAVLSVADIRGDRVDQAVEQFGATALRSDEIAYADVDLYCPCALGGVITVESAQAIRARAVAGAANNQLATPQAGEALAAQGILFAPDYVLNAGGIMSALEAANHLPGRKQVVVAPLEERLAGIYTRLTEIFERASVDGRTPEQSAEHLAREMIGR